MKWFAVSFLAVLLAPAMAFAKPEVRLDGILYHLNTDIEDSLYKDGVQSSGLYAYYGVGLDKSHELELDFIQIDYPNIGSFDQQDLTYVYTKYEPENSVRYGFHYINSNDTRSNNGGVIFIGKKTYKSWKKNSQIDGYLSFYNNYEPDLQVVQATPRFGQSWKSGNGKFYAQTSGYYIQLLEDAGTNDRNYFSAEESITYSQDKISLTGYGWVGKQAFAVRNDGFAVYNKAEEIKGGFGGSVKLVLSEDSSLTIGASREKFSDVGANNNARAVSYVVSIGHTF